MTRLLLLFSFISITSCSAYNTERVVYDAARRTAMNDCEQHVDSHSRDCRAEYQQTFEEYRQEREELKKNKQ